MKSWHKVEEKVIKKLYIVLLSYLLGITPMNLDNVEGFFWRSFIPVIFPGTIVSLGLCEDNEMFIKCLRSLDEM